MLEAHCASSQSNSRFNTRQALEGILIWIQQKKLWWIMWWKWEKWGVFIQETQNKPSFLYSWTQTFWKFLIIFLAHWDWRIGCIQVILEQSHSLLCPLSCVRVAKTCCSSFHPAMKGVIYVSLLKTEQCELNTSRVNWGVIDSYCGMKMTAWRYNKHLTPTWRIWALLVDWHPQHNTPTLWVADLAEM